LKLHIVNYRKVVKFRRKRTRITEVEKRTFKTHQLGSKSTPLRLIAD
jgi:hypothetical protein